MSESLIRRRSLPSSLRYLAQKLDGPLTDGERAGVVLALNSLADEAETARDVLAHELAEQLRSHPEARKYGRGKWAADLITPSAGPVRPGEEPTV